MAGFWREPMAFPTVPAAKTAPPLPSPSRGGRYLTSNNVNSAKQREGRTGHIQVLAGKAGFCNPIRCQNKIEQFFPNQGCETYKPINLSTPSNHTYPFIYSLP
ncbi:MAG TPA: hypothetical protein VK957_04425 [Lunatimonas sp.]|nr:hypothetical protein [Lunatimonas sp.]